MISSLRRRRWGPSLGIAAGAAVVIAAIGLFLSRPDLVAVALPLALWCALASSAGTPSVETTVTLTPLPSDDAEVRTGIHAVSDADAVEIALVQAGRRARRLIVAGGAMAEARSTVLHSGPLTAVQAVVRGFDADAAVLHPASDPVVSLRTISPPRRPLDSLPVPRRLRGLHGAHLGRRPGHGGDFRDIHPFAPGDELRRVDWRATARMARRPGDLLVRRTATLSEASVVIAMDTAEDLGAVVASWGSDDGERSGVTSLDLAREAARSLAATAIVAGDRVALHVLVYGGRSLPSGGGSRHLARLEAAIAATGQAREDTRFRRTPQVPHDSVIYVLSTFFEGAATETALMWRGAGHRVVAVDVLPDLDRSRLSSAQRVALRVVLSERDTVFADLEGAGVDVLRWDEGVAIALRAASRVGR